MEFTEEFVAEREISDYEIERDKPMPSILHSIVQNNLITFLNVNFGTKFRFMSEIRQNITEKKTTPDIAVYENFVVDWNNDSTSFDKTPLLNIEILSPEQTLGSLEKKVKKYFEVGVKSCWIVFPSIKLIVIYFQDGKNKVFDENETLKDEILNIEIPLKEIFK